MGSRLFLWKTFCRVPLPCVRTACGFCVVGMSLSALCDGRRPEGCVWQHVGFPVPSAADLVPRPSRVTETSQVSTVGRGSSRPASRPSIVLRGSSHLGGTFRGRRTQR